MNRSLRLFAWFMFGFLIVAFPLLSFAAAIYPVSVPGVSAVGSELIYTSRAGVASMVYPSLATSAPLSIPVSTMVPPGRQLMVIPAAIAVNGPRVAAAVVGLARLSGPVGLGLTLLPILCEETGICQSTTNPTVYEKPTTSSNTSLLGYKLNEADPISSTPLAACQYYRSDMTTATPWSTDSVTGFVTYNCGIGTTLWNFLAVPVVGCGAGYTLSGSTCTGPSTVAPPTENDWSSAVSKLTAAVSKMAQLVSGLQGMNQPVPIDKPVLSPTSSTSSPISTVNRDPQGNVINTTNTSTTTNVAPVTNTSTTNTVLVTQITNTTITNNLGQVTGTTETASDPPPPEDPEIEFDTVPDSPLEKQELPITLTPVSWGEGSCPPDPSVSVLGHQVAVPVHVVCQYMSGVRTAVIAVFALIAAYIVVGVKFEG